MTTPQREEAGELTKSTTIDDVPTAESASEECAATLHGLNNALLTILLNSQMIDWKLPTYSKIRRNVHEIERSAQRAGVLVKRLLVAQAGHSGSRPSHAGCADRPVDGER